MKVPDSVIKEYETNGYAILRDVIDPDLIGELSAHVDWLGRKYPDLRPEDYHHPLMRDDAFWVRAVTDSRLIDIAESFLGPDIACFTAHYVCKPPVDGRPVLWHQDGAYWKLQPMRALTVWLAVDPSTVENGCLRMVPGSHVLPLQPPLSRTDIPNMLQSWTDPVIVQEWVDRAGVMPVELNPGDVSIHHPNILHCSEPNTSNRRRCGLDIGYMPATTRISNDGLYLNPILVRGSAVRGVNDYRAYPRYVEGETIRFRGCDTWNHTVALSHDGQIASHEETPLAITHRMIDRLRAGTVKQ